MFSQTCILHHGCKLSLKHTFMSLKNIICLFSLMCPSKTLPQVLTISYSRSEDITHFLQAMLFENLLFPAERGKDYEAEKMTKIKLSQVLINPTIYTNKLFCCKLWPCKQNYLTTVFFKVIQFSLETFQNII